MTPNARQELIKKCGGITPAYDDSFPLVDAIEGPYNVAKRFYGLCQRIFEARWLEFTVVGIHRPGDTSQSSCDHNEGRRT